MFTFEKTDAKNDKGIEKYQGNYTKIIRDTILYTFLFFCMTKRKETKEKSPAVCRALPKIWGHSNFGGDKTRYAQTVSPLSEILAPFLTPDTMPEVVDPLTHIV